jgi:hypothetical protein
MSGSKMNTFEQRMLKQQPVLYRVTSKRSAERGTLGIPYRETKDMFYLAELYNVSSEKYAWEGIRHP